MVCDLPQTGSDSRSLTMTSASTGSCLEMQNLGLQPGPSESESAFELNAWVIHVNISV